MTKIWTVLATASLLALFAPTPLARADIFQWEYINPANPNQGKQQSTTLCIDGAGVDAVSGAILSSRNLTKAYLVGAYLGLSPIFDEYGDLVDFIAAANLTGANLSQADLSNSGFLGGTLDNANLSQASLTNAYFYLATLTSANLSQANLTHARFSAYGFYGADRPGADLSQTNLSQTNLTNAIFAGYREYDDSYGYIITPGANLTGANLSGADARGARFEYATLTGANTSNLIQSGGHIAGLDLTAGASLVVRDYDGNPAAAPPTAPLPIVVEQHLAMDASGTLRLEFDADPWNSTISFAPSIPVTLGATLELTFAPGVDVATQSGRTIDLFDWTGVTPSGAFTVSSPYAWNLSNLYTTGEVTLSTLLAGDYSGDGIVDAADFTVWRDRLGSLISLPNDDTPGVGPDDYERWKENYGQTAGAGSIAIDNEAVPEPSTLVLLMLAAAGWRFRADGPHSKSQKLINA